MKIGVIHPIESYWLHYDPREQTEAIRADKEEKFRDITEWLLFGAVDFDFIAESLLPNQCEKGSNPLQVVQMNYQVIIVPECETLRSTTYERLSAFKAKGGRLIFLGKSPKYMDSLPNEQVKKLYNQIKKLYNQSEQISYKIKVKTTKEKLVIHVPQYREALVSVSLDGQEVGKIVFAPYTLTLENLTLGEHEIELKVFGNRVNAFGAVHNCDGEARWFRPDGWRSVGERWSYEYTLKKMGILTCPCIIEK